MKLLLVTLFGVLAPSLYACVSVPPDICPSLREYTLIEQKALADELPAAGLETQAWIEDYITLRAACQKARQGNDSDRH